jgi:hypothetical protein
MFSIISWISAWPLWGLLLHSWPLGLLFRFRNTIIPDQSQGQKDTESNVSVPAREEVSHSSLFFFPSFHLLCLFIYSLLLFYTHAVAL